MSVWRQTKNDMRGRKWKKTDRERDRERDRETDIQTDRQTERGIK